MFFRRASEDGDGWPRFEAFNPVPPDAAYSPNGGAEPISRYVPMGAVAGDLAEDGALDLAVTLDPTVSILQGRAAWPFADRSLDSVASRVLVDAGIRSRRLRRGRKNRKGARGAREQRNGSDSE